MEAADRARNRAPAIAVLCSVQFIDVLGVTVVVTALPRMLTDLGAPAADGSLVSGGYAMFFGGLLMLGARLGDRFGHRRTIIASLAVSGLGALLGAVAGSVVLLTAARCLQGAGAAGSVPSALRLLTSLPADGLRRRAIAAWSAAGASAGASGFVIGGVVTDLTSWRWVFWAWLPLTGALAAAVLRYVPFSPGTVRPRSVNAAAAAAFTAAVMAVVVGTTLIAQPGRRAAGAVIVLLAAPLTAAFVRADRRARAPLLPAAVLAIPALRRGALGAYINTATTSSAMTLATLYLQDSLRRSPLAAAAMLLPFSLAAAQLGTATGIAVLLLIAAATTGPARAPVAAWAAAAAIAAGGALAFSALAARRRDISLVRAVLLRAVLLLRAVPLLRAVLLRGARSSWCRRHPEGSEKTMKFMMLVCMDGASFEAAEAAGDARDTSDAPDTSDARDGGSFPWLDDVIARGIRLDGDRLRPPREAKTVEVRDGEVLISDGPFAETKEVICGFDILECADIDEAVKVAAAHPVAGFGRIEVRAFWPG